MAFNGTRFVIPTKSGAYITLKNIDFTSLTQIEVMAVAPKAQLSALGGFIEIRTDSPGGKLLGKSDFIGDTGGGFGGKPVVINLAPTEGTHDLYMVFTNEDPKASGALMVVMNTTVKTSQLTIDPSTAVETKANPGDYVGKYKMTGLPFEFITVTEKDGKLFMEAGGQGGELKQTGNDTFDAGGQAKISFVRESGMVKSMKMEAMGFNFEGTKEK
jgi:cytochrome c